MTEDIRRYRTLLEQAGQEIMEREPAGDLDTSAREAAELVAHIFRDSTDADLTDTLYQALRGYHKETAGHHDFKDWGRAVLKHAARMHHTIHED